MRQVARPHVTVITQGAIRFHNPDVHNVVAVQYAEIGRLARDVSEPSQERPCPLLDARRSKVRAANLQRRYAQCISTAVRVVGQPRLVSQALQQTQRRGFGNIEASADLGQRLRRLSLSERLQDGQTTL